jgi:hypothetical protein
MSLRAKKLSNQHRAMAGAGQAFTRSMNFAKPASCWATNFLVISSLSFSVFSSNLNLNLFHRDNTKQVRTHHSAMCYGKCACKQRLPKWTR